MLTGEPTRVEREKGALVLAGSENGLRPLVIEAAQTGHETVLDQVITLVSRAREVRGILQRTTDRVFAWYVPAVLLVAAVSSAGWAIFGPPGSASTYAAVCAIGVFVVACPCAVGLTTAASVIAMRRAAGAGVLFREATVLERLAAVDTILRSIRSCSTKPALSRKAGRGSWLLCRTVEDQKTPFWLSLLQSSVAVNTLWGWQSSGKPLDANWGSPQPIPWYRLLARGFVASLTVRSYLLAD
jgi:hypothetical protein